MKPKILPRQKQGNFLYQDLLKQLNPKDPLLLLAKKNPLGDVREGVCPVVC
jgi:hypothetical protein